MSLGGEELVRKTVTVLFCDVVGSTALGETVDPETTRRVMLRYFDKTRAVLETHGGTVEKFIGDAVMAVFGVPLVHEDDALRAVRAADELRTQFGRLNAELEEQFGVHLEWRMGVNTGEVVVGDPSGTQTIASGDTVNVAARLQQAAEPGDVLLGRETYRLVRDRIEAGPREAFSLKGKRDAVAPWRLEQVHERAADMLRRHDSPFVGREFEREAVEAAYRATVEESACKLLTLVGLPGIGKTRLAQECISRLLSAQVLQGRCLPYGEGITFWPIKEIVRGAAAIAADDGAEESRTKVQRLLRPGEESALVCDRVCGTVGFDGHAPRTEESFWALRRLFESIASARPLVLVFEDLHWGEPTLLDLIEYLVGWSSGAPILLFCVARPELLDSRASFAQGAVVLEPLDAADIGAVATNALGSRPVDPAVVERVAEAADGNPLFAQEFARMLVDDALLSGDDGVWSATQSLATLSIPPTINALLSARLDRLDPDEREVMQCASVVGKEFWWGSVADLLDPAQRAGVASRLQSLVRKRLVFPAGSSVIIGEDAFRFSHILVRDAAYAALSKSRRAEMHERHAEWLLANAGDRATELEEIVGYHLEQASQARLELAPVDPAVARLTARAAGHLGAAGRRALARGDTQAAARLLRRAAALDDGAAAELAPALGTALMESGALTEADEFLSRAIETARATGDELREAHATVIRAGVRFRTHPTWAFGETRAVAETAIETFTGVDDDAGLAQALRLLSATHGWHSEWRAMGGALERALVHARRAGDSGSLATIEMWLNVALYYGPMPAEETVARYSATLAAVEDESAVAGHTACLLAGALAMTGRFGEARIYAGRGTSTLAGLGLPVRLGHARAYIAEAEWLAGDAGAAEHELAEAYAIHDGIGDRSGALSAAIDLAHLLCSQGRYDEADRWAALGRDVLEESDVMTHVTGLATEAQLTAHAGREGAARELAARAVELAERTDALNLRAGAWSSLAAVLRQVRRPDDASEAAETAVRLYELKGNVAAARRSLAAPTAGR